MAKTVNTGIGAKSPEDALTFILQYTKDQDGGVLLSMLRGLMRGECVAEAYKAARHIELNPGNYFPRIVTIAGDYIRQIDAQNRKVESEAA